MKVCALVAHGGAAAECLRIAPKREAIEMVEAKLSCEFALSSAVHGLLTQLQAEKLAEKLRRAWLTLAFALTCHHV